MYNRYLNRKLPLYVISGLVFAALLGATITIGKLNRSLEDLIDKANIINVRSAQMLRDRDEIRARARAVSGTLSEGIGRPSSELIIKAADGIRRTLAGDTLSLSEITRGQTETVMPIEVTFAFDGYAQVIKRIDYLERLAFPFFRLKSFQYDGVGKGLCIVRGELVMPASGEMRK